LAGGGDELLGGWSEVTSWLWTVNGVAVVGSLQGGGSDQAEVWLNVAPLSKISMGVN